MRMILLALASVTTMMSPAVAQDIVVMRKPMRDTNGDPTQMGVARWRTGDWSASSTSCGLAVQNRPVTCVNGIGNTIDQRICNSATRPDSRQEMLETSGCSYDWQTGAWNLAPTCGTTTRTRTVSCRRSDGTMVDGTECLARSGSQPVASESVQDYGTCSYAWEAGAWSAKSSSCSSSATRTRDVSCKRSNGDKVAESLCDASIRPTASESSVDYTGCTYQWKGTYGAWDSTCASNATRSVTWTCRRSDDAAAAGSLCGQRPSGTETASISTGCSLVAPNPGFEDTSDWQFTQNAGGYTSADKHSGSRSIIVGSYAQANPYVALPGIRPGSKYRLAFWAKGGGTILASVYGQQGQSRQAISAGTTDEWVRYEVDFVSQAPASMEFLQFYKILLNQPTTYVDDVSVVPVP